MYIPSRRLNPRSTQHLEAADLLIVERRGRERWNHLNPLPIHQIHARWIGPLAAQAVGVLDVMKGGVGGVGLLASVTLVPRIPPGIGS